MACLIDGEEEEEEKGEHLGRWLSRFRTKNDNLSRAKEHPRDR